MRLILSMAVIILTGLGAAVSADPLTGLWQTPPDRKDLVSHIEVSRCGGAFCGRVLRSFDSEGAQVRTPNIGKRIFWGVKPLGDGDYGKGRAWVPLLDINVSARLSLSESHEKLTVSGCKVFICDSQTWTRLK